MAAKKQARSLREARKAARMTLEQVAQRTGLTRQAVSFWETGVNVPRGSARILLAMIFEVDSTVVDSWFEKRAA